MSKGAALDKQVHKLRVADRVEQADVLAVPPFMWKETQKA
jgi:hypothetical protein